jgi:High potential iron-sulfur protein
VQAAVARLGELLCVESALAKGLLNQASVDSGKTLFEEAFMNRKEALQSLIVLPALAGFIAGTGAIAEAKGSKSQFKYQDKPNGKQKCSGCSLFVPGKSATANGTCKVVEGAISPNGWCTAFSPKA